MSINNYKKFSSFSVTVKYDSDFIKAVKKTLPPNEYVIVDNVNNDHVNIRFVNVEIVMSYDNRCILVIDMSKNKHITQNVQDTGFSINRDYFKKKHNIEGYKSFDIDWRKNKLFSGHQTLYVPDCIDKHSVSIVIRDFNRRKNGPDSFCYSFGSGIKKEIWFRSHYNYLYKGNNNEKDKSFIFKFYNFFTKKLLPRKRN